ncbi:AEC family transporter [Paucibacter sp. Y2R2-4]|uniref:AEC family transporter n=1 Tax=Paucibacter sp. Y2R2-4 TaxID=2893553 RepID=UPI0021E3D235|nr:AEC family transporter [Paucibacter sp. Y2R2-4]MCV2348258.1 AEC family transporter [Paucibacter sp. Y2R2-4]
MPDVLLLLPDFLLILCGFVLCRYSALNRPVWESAERLVYYLLFPVLLFNSILRTPLQLGSTAGLALGGLATVLSGVVLAYALRWLPAWRGESQRQLHASGAQVAFRFNSFIALALAERLQGSQGVAWVALLIALCVPVCNVAAVWPLARHGGHGYWRELSRNPLILSTVAGLLANLASLRLPEPAALTLHRIGLAALPLGLMAVGAGLRFGALKQAPGLATALLSIRHLVLPLVALLIAQILKLQAEQRAMLLMFAALPTASSAYVLAVRMGGNGPFVAGLVTLSTLLGMLSLPLWLMVLNWL